jgi:RHS repeat-associated protein
VLTDVTGTVQNAYGYEAFGEEDYALGTIENKYLFTGEQYDNNVGFYYLRARYYNPTNGRFSQMDTFPGMMHEPKSLHKYTYTHADPVNGTDPSGHINLSELGTARNISGILHNYAKVIYRFTELYDKFESLSTFLEFLGAVRKLVGGAADLSDLRPPSDFFNDAGNSIDFKEAAKSFSFNMPKSIGIGAKDWAKGISNSRRRRQDELKEFLLYMPSPGVNAGFSPSVTTGLKVKFRKLRIPVKLVFGGNPGTKGNLFGYGVKVGNTRRQLMRMDSHDPYSNHTGRGKELGYWPDNPFHYHVYRWNGNSPN